jgi:diguanylate cyclase (GGDEF)-like protein
VPNTPKVHPDAETSAHVLRARRTAAAARGAIGACGVVLLLTDRALSADRTLAYVGFAFILATAILQLVLLESKWMKLEEAFALPALLIIGLGEERVTVLSALWLAAVASGVLARGGRVHWVGRLVVVGSLLLPIGLENRLTLTYAALCVGTVALLFTCGRVTHELQTLLARARWDADHDQLTGAFSRTKFRDVLDTRGAAATAESPLTLLLVDLDHFGQINKTSGHAAGDRLLANVGARLGERAGPDGIVGRLGGDEFGVALPDLHDAEGLAREIISELGGGELGVAASIGITRAPADGHTADSLLRAADIALRIAKRAGRQQVSAYAGDSLSDEGPGGARAALARLIEGEDLSIFVQPIVELASGVPHAFEALARFETGSTSSPLHWFALSEEFGLRPELELACLRAALELLEELPGDARLSVNLSGSLLLDERTSHLLLGTPDVSRLIIELTENTLVKDTPELRSAIAGLRRRGAHLAVDDMGAGYSGLRQITSVQAGYLKLDRSLVTGIESSPERQALIAALLGYAERMGGALVAEGVETDEELEAIRELGVPLVQGYLFGRPGPPWPKHADGDMVSARARTRS